MFISVREPLRRVTGSRDVGFAADGKGGLPRRATLAAARKNLAFRESPARHFRLYIQEANAA